MTYTDVFTLEEFQVYVKSKGGKISKTDALDILHNSNLVFSLVNQEFITRAGVFEDRWFSFRPSKEEVEKGSFMIGHRCMPFINPDAAPDSLNVVSGTKKIVPVAESFSMNLAMDTFAFYGEGYVIPYIINDHSNKKISLSQIQYNLPNEVTLTSWPLKELENGECFKFGDRILCRVVDWSSGTVEMQIQKNDLNDLVISESSVQREQWYSIFEDGLLKSFDRNGPTSSIETQLSYLFLENQHELCIQNCGSCEEFLKHTKRIGFSPYGVESRIWRNGEEVPYVGKWNEKYADDLLFTDMNMTYTPDILDAYLENYIYEERTNKKRETLEEMIDRILIGNMTLKPSERKMVLLNIEKRHAILEQNYSQFTDYGIAPVRQRILELFTKVNEIVLSIGCTRIKISDFPQQELVILSQLYGHIGNLLSEIENPLLREQFPIDDVNLSLEGMEETFESIEFTLKSALEKERYSGFGIVN